MWSSVFPNVLLNFEKKQAIKSQQKEIVAKNACALNRKKQGFTSCTRAKSYAF